VLAGDATMKAQIGVDAKGGQCTRRACPRARFAMRRLLACFGGEEEGEAGARPHTTSTRRNRRVGKVSAKVERVFRVLKCQFGYRKVRYRGIAKNGVQVFALLALANLYLVRGRLTSA
jgi:transposase, IS5 family